MLLWNGSCIVHETFSDRKIISLKMQHPNALLIAHPECEEVILEKTVQNLPDEAVRTTNSITRTTATSATSEGLTLAKVEEEVLTHETTIAQRSAGLARFLEGTSKVLAFAEPAINLYNNLANPETQGQTVRNISELLVDVGIAGASLTAGTTAGTAVGGLTIWSGPGAIVAGVAI